MYGRPVIHYRLSMPPCFCIHTPMPGDGLKRLDERIGQWDVQLRDKLKELASKKAHGASSLSRRTLRKFSSNSSCCCSASERKSASPSGSKNVATAKRYHMNRNTCTSLNRIGKAAWKRFVAERFASTLRSLARYLSRQISRKIACSGFANAS